MTLRYDADIAPDPAAWLAADEDERATAIEEHHADWGSDALHPAEANVLLHCRMHLVVENQIATGEPAIAGETVDRLVGVGIRRHLAIHFVARVLVEHLHAAFENREFDDAGYAADLTAIDPSDALAGELRRAVARDADPPKPNRAQRRAARRKKR